jgi:hypothetical protein
MNYHFVQEHTDDVEDVYLDDIEECSDSEQLTDWYQSWALLTESIKTDVESYKFVGTAEAEWLARCGGKLSAMCKGMKAVEARMLTLGMEPPYLPTDPRNRTIRQLEAKCIAYKKALKGAGIVLENA